MSLGVDLVDKCPTCKREDVVEITDGITYNLMPMFRDAGWDHRDYDDWTAAQMLPLAEQVLETLRSDPPMGGGTTKTRFGSSASSSKHAGKIQRTK